MIDEIEIKLPRTRESIERYFLGCKKRKRFVRDAPGHHMKRLKKAKHDLSCALDELDDGNWDWTIVKAYYAIHHAANALFSKEKGMFSKDHSCLIIALKYHNLIDDRLFSRLMRIYEGFSDSLSIGIAFELRKIGQYDVDKWEDLTRDDASMVLETAKEFVSYVERCLYD